MADERLCWQPATELAAAIRRKRVSPVEVVDAILERVERINPKLNAFVTLTDEAARREAKALSLGLMRSTRSRIASTTSTGEIFFRLISAASSVAGSQQSRSSAIPRPPSFRIPCPLRTRGGTPPS